ncbi:hypothetical protein J2W96_006221 [Variovorax guangxiensis]|nr:hypothetical protein [Variovorax guangxiensis]
MTTSSLRWSEELLPVRDRGLSSPHEGSTFRTSPWDVLWLDRSALDRARVGVLPLARTRPEEGGRPPQQRGVHAEANADDHGRTIREPLTKVQEQ